MEYEITMEDGCENLPELMPLYATHYEEMRQRRESDGEHLPHFKPRVSEYQKAWAAGYLLNFVVRHDGRAVGYSNVYITNDMHNGELIAQEDTIFVLRDHRNGIGKKLVRAILQELESRGVRRVYITPVTDLRVEQIWKRMGFQTVSSLMTYSFEG